MNIQSNTLLSIQHMFPEYLLHAGFSITARGDVKAVPEEVLHKHAPHWDKCIRTHMGKTVTGT